MNEIRQNIADLRELKAKVFQEINMNEEESAMIVFRLRQIADTEGSITDIMHKLETLETVLGSLAVTTDNRKRVTGKREYLIRNLHRAALSDINMKKQLTDISSVLPKYLNPEEKDQFEKYMKNKIKLILKLLNTEKKIQYEINRFKILDSH